MSSTVGVVGVEHDTRRGPVPTGELARRTRDHGATVVHHDHLVGEAFGLEEEVRAHEDGLAVLGHLVDEAEHGAGRLGVEAGGRFVEEQEVGIVEHGPGEREAGPHAGGVAADLAGRARRRCRSAGRVGDAVTARGPGPPRRARPRTRGCRCRSGGRTARGGRAPRRTVGGSRCPRRRLRGRARGCGRRRRADAARR